MVRALWVNIEHTLSKQSANVERNLVSAYEQWTMSKQSTNARAKWRVNARWMICEGYVNATWTIYLECLGRYPCIVFRCLRGKNKLHVCIAISLNIILFDWTLNEHWTDSERKVNGERKRSGAEIASERMMNVLWAHSERTEKWESRTFQGLLSWFQSLNFPFLCLFRLWLDHGGCGAPQWIPDPLWFPWQPCCICWLWLPHQVPGSR